MTRSCLHAGNPDRSPRFIAVTTTTVRHIVVVTTTKHLACITRQGGRREDAYRWWRPGTFAVQDPNGVLVIITPRASLVRPSVAVAVESAA